MNIALISTTGFSTPPKSYGGEIEVSWLCNALCKLGHTVILFATYDSMTPSNGTLIRLRKAQLGDWVTMLDSEYDVIRYYSDILRRVDIVHDFAHNAQVSLWCKENNIPYCNTLWGNSFLGNRLGLPSFHRDNCVCWSEDHKICGINGYNGYEGTPWHKKYPFAGKLNPTTKVVLGGVDTEFYDYKPDIKREDWFLFLARAHEAKGVDLAIDIAKRNPQVKFKFSGSFSGKLHETDGNKYLEMIRQLPNASFIKADTHEEKRYLYSKCKAYLFPVQYHESFGIVVAEALSCGTPCIVSDRGSMPEIIENSVNGFVCRNIEHYESAIRAIDYIRPKTCRKIADNKFSMKRVATDYVEVYKCAIRGDKW